MVLNKNINEPWNASTDLKRTFDAIAVKDFTHAAKGSLGITESVQNFLSNNLAFMRLRQGTRKVGAPLLIKFKA
jgi:hypothetical protein